MGRLALLHALAFELLGGHRLSMVCPSRARNFTAKHTGSDAFDTALRPDAPAVDVPITIAERRAGYPLEPCRPKGVPSLESEHDGGMRVIFLDFDGVLHRPNCLSKDQWAHMSILEDLMASHPNTVRI
jgi:hypothetical protein